MSKHLCIIHQTCGDKPCPLCAIPTGPVSAKEVRDLPKKILAPSLPAVPDTKEEPHTDFCFARDVIAGIDTAYKDYVQLLNDEINDLVGLAHVHGWRSRRVEDGKLARERIANALALWQTELDWHEGRALDSLNEPQAPSMEPKGPKSNAGSEFSQIPFETGGRNALNLQMALKWIPTTERLPEFCRPVIGYADRWVHPDYNELGMRECFRNDDYWQSAAYNNYQDCWDAEEGAPDYWMPYPAVPFSENLQSAQAASDGKEQGEH